MSSSHSKQTGSYDLSQPNLYWVNGILFAILIGVVVSVIWCIGYYQTTKSTQYRVVEASYVPNNVAILRTNELTELNKLEWKDKPAGVVKLPISDAMNAVVLMYQ